MPGGILRVIAVVALAMCGAALSMAPGCSRDQSADVRPDFAAERSTTYELTLVTQINHAVMITGEKASLDELVVRFRVETTGATPDGGAFVTLRIERFAFQNAGESMKRVRFDSELPDEQNTPDAMTPLFRSLAGLGIALRLAPDGSATYLDGLGPVGSLIAERADREQLGPVFEPRWWADLAASVFRLGSEKPRIGVGDAWNQDYRFAERGSMTLSGLLERRVVSLTEDRIEIEESGGFTVDFSRDVFASMEEAAVDQQDISGRIVWDRRHGRLLEDRRDLVLQLSQTWQGIVLAKRHAISRTLRRVSGE
jgi:hypothetical protein